MKFLNITVFLLCAAAIGCQQSKNQAGIRVVPAAPERSSNSPEDYLAYPDGSFLLENARVVSGLGAPTREGVDVAIVDGTIVGVGTNLQPPEGATRIDLTGHTVLPGLVHMHEHFNYMSSPFHDYDTLIVDPHPFSMPKLFLSAGVTTVRTAGTDAIAHDSALRRMIEAGEALGPRVSMTGHIVDGPGVPLLINIATYEEGRQFVRSQVPFGVTSIKVYSQTPPEALRGVLDEAHAHGLHVAGHLGSGTSCTEAAALGIDTIEHGFQTCIQDLPALRDRESPFRLEENLDAIDALIATLVKNGVVMVTTPSGGRAANYSEEARSVFAPAMRDALERIGLEEGNRSESGNPTLVLSVKDETRKIERRFVDAGGRLLMGADAMYLPIIPGYANQDVMVELARTFTPLEVIRMATADAAAFLGMGDTVGQVAPGFAADLLITRGRPDVRMADIRDVALVFSRGRALDPVRLREAARGRVGYD
ncbi:MAG: amidohydrolase family protein [Myxococcota bacterium]